MIRDYYESPKAGIIMKLLWKAAGADEYVLNKSTYSDQVKYACLGGIVFATGFMAALAGGYAFYTIFEPKGDAFEKGTDNLTAIKSIVFGLIWGLIIFNIDRFIVAATGKGDGTEKITKSEFINAIPRIIMGLVIAITISKPMEIRMFKSEIDVKLYEKQLEAEKLFKEQANANFDDRISLNDGDLEKIEKQRNQLNDLLIATTIKYNEIADKTITRYRTKTDDEGNTTRYRYTVPHPSIKSYEKQMDKLTHQLQDFDLKNEAKLKKIEAYKAKMQTEKDDVLGNNKKVSSGLDGLLERIKLAHEVAGFGISLFITLLFVVIELTPIFFKMMLIKSPYDYINDNIADLIKAENGIQIKYDYYKDKEGQERNLVINHQSKRKIDEQMALIKAQTELSNYVIEKWKNEEKKKADDNLDNYISES